MAGNEYAECQIISRGERLLCSVEYFADLLGYKVIQENGDYDITYLTAHEEILTDEKRAEAEERFELYRTVVCDTSDVESEQNGVGKYAKTDYEDRLVGIAYSTWFESLSKWERTKHGFASTEYIVPKTAMPFTDMVSCLLTPVWILYLSIGLITLL